MMMTKVPDLVPIQDYSLINDKKYFDINDFVVLLTSTVYTHSSIPHVQQSNYNDRIRTYENSILRWINESNLDIVIVENSGYDFSYLLDKNRNVEFVSVPKSYLDYSLSDKDSQKTIKGQMETLSLEYALNNSSIVKTKKFIIKITGRYFIPNFEYYLDKVPIETDIIRQHDNLHCEIFGATVPNAKLIFKYPLPKITTLEYYLYIIGKKTNNIVRLPRLDIPETTSGQNRIIKYL